MNHLPACFAPKVTEERLTTYEALANTAAPNIKDGMLRLITMCRLFNETPESTEPGEEIPIRHRGKFGGVTVTPLEKGEVTRIWDSVPWLTAKDRIEKGKIGDDDCDQYAEMFDLLPAGDLRDAAFHLVWQARELALDREPMTLDKLPG